MKRYAMVMVRVKAMFRGGITGVRIRVMIRSCACDCRMSDT